MNELLGNLRQPSLWTVSVQLLVLYVVGVAIFYAANAVYEKAAAALKERVARGAAGPSAGLFVLAAALNLAGVLALVLVTRKTGENVRMAMVGVPLFLIIERHVRQLRAHPEDRRLHLLGMAGVALGVVAGVVLLMPNAPLK